MKKLLFVLLIALVASTVVQTEDKELDGFFDLIAKFVASLVGKNKALYNMLKSLGVWDRIVNLVKQRNIQIAFNVCSGYTGENNACGDMINSMGTLA